MRSVLLVAGLFAAGTVAAQTYEDGYRKGFQDGFSAGQQSVTPPPPAPALAPAPALQPAPVLQQAPVQAAPVAPALSPNYGITIMRATYGDGRRECNLTGRLAGKMNGRNSASLDVTNQLCGDPAPGERKYLRVDYTCGGAAKQASANEHRTLHLSCP